MELTASSPVQSQTPATASHALEIASAAYPTALAALYVFKRNLGKGSQGQVWLAERRTDGEHVAVKQLNVHSVTTWKQYELFKREAKILESLNIEGVAPFYEYIEDLDAQPPFVCIVQKFIEGKTLAEMLKTKYRFETKTIYDIVAQTLRILQKLHDYHPPVVHRDIKPSNLMLTPMGNGRFNVTLLDFGAVANPQVQNGGSTVAGTFGYMPPEQLMGQAQPASDIYALAAVAVELLSGTSPADIPVCDFKLVIEPYLMGVPEQVVQVLNAMLEPVLDNRFCDHAALIAQFDALANQKQPSMLDFLRRTTVSKLEDVESICQPGNYEIWQNLDQTKKIKYHDWLCCFNILDIPKSILSHIGESTFARILGLYFLSFFVFLMLVVKSFYERALPRPKLLHTRTIELHTRTIDIFNTFDKLSDISCKGQKTVGSITAIHYQNTSEDYSAIYKTKNDELPRVISYDIPKFVVKYRFQYLYEGKNYELYGQLITHVAPENHYKIGDPITLIANITSSDEALELSVFPYPYPFKDALNMDEIICSCATQKSMNIDDLLKCPKQVALKTQSGFETADS